MVPYFSCVFIMITYTSLLSRSESPGLKYSRWVHYAVLNQVGSRLVDFLRARLEQLCGAQQLLFCCFIVKFKSASPFVDFMVLKSYDFTCCWSSACVVLGVHHCLLLESFEWDSVGYWDMWTGGSHSYPEWSTCSHLQVDGSLLQRMRVWGPSSGFN